RWRRSRHSSPAPRATLATRPRAYRLGWGEEGTVRGLRAGSRKARAAAARLALAVTRERQPLRALERHGLQRAGVEVQRLQDGRRHLAQVDRRRDRAGAGLRADDDERHVRALVVERAVLALLRADARGRVDDALLRLDDDVGAAVGRQV